MKVMVCYPPIYKFGRVPLLGQNRQFRFSSSNEIRIYPIVPSTAATMLAEDDFKVKYLDGINERLSWEGFVKALHDFEPDLIAIETKTPVVRVHWYMIDQLKKDFPDTRFALMGDHVSFAPDESLKNSQVDFVLTGGDYDVSLLKVARRLRDDRNPLPKGVWYRHGDDVRSTGNFELTSNLDSLPFIDRDLTKWWLYGEAYLHHPCTYIMWGRGCYPGRCSFCVWASNFWLHKSRLRSVKNVLDEIEKLVDELHVEEIFDDTDTSTWNGLWLRDICEGLMERRLNDKVYISCNARADTLTKENCQLMKKSGFRLLKVGLESGCDKTLRRINKCETVAQIRRGVKNAKDAGLNVLLTIMVGYPWETEKDAQATLKFAKELMLYKTHVGDSLQASVTVPYPGTPLYFEAIKNDWFQIEPDNYEAFDMSYPPLKSPVGSEKTMELCDRLWRIHIHPLFVTKTLASISSIDDFRYLWQGLKSLIGHTRDF
jgi:anaerobic magnesium-protoporphyrin IX monomethyl ester cyclase